MDLTREHDRPDRPASAGPATRIDTVICDYGGVLTNPLAETLDAFARTNGLGAASIIEALGAATERHGVNPMAALEVGAITEDELVARISAELPHEGWRLPAGTTFGQLWFAGRTGNHALTRFLRDLRRRGYRLALLTNNVLEWEELWRATIPVDELFDVVVNSAHERVRKPDLEIYQRMLDRLDTTGEHCLFVDDIAENLTPAERLGIRTVHFTDTDQATAAIRDALGLDGDGIHRTADDTARTGAGQETT